MIVSLIYNSVETLLGWIVVFIKRRIVNICKKIKRNLVSAQMDVKFIMMRVLISVLLFKTRRIKLTIPLLPLQLGE